MLLPVLAFGLGGLALWLTRESGTPVSPAPSHEFAPEVVTHSPEFLARESKGKPMADSPRTILFLGDSLTASGYWKKITLPGVDVRGKGWPGKQAKYIVEQAGKALDETKPTDVVFLAGVNNVASGQTATRVQQDLTNAWSVFKSRGARVWAVKLTPWYGYKFFNDAKKAPALRAVTEAVNAFMVSKTGQPDGPDYVIDTAALGDADRKLLKAYSHDGLHMNGKGYKALGLLVQAALAPAIAAQVGAEAIPPELQLVIDELVAKLKKSNLAPDAVELDWRTITFVYKDVVAETTVLAAELLPKKADVDGKVYHFATRTAGRSAAVGADVPADVQRAIDLFTDRLVRNDVGPVGVEYTVDPQTRYRYVTFTFYTGFRAQRAAEILPGGYKTGAQMLYLKTRVVEPSAEVGIAVPDYVQAVIDGLVDRLTRNDAAPAGVEYAVVDGIHTVTFSFYTQLRANRADELLSGSYAAGPHGLYVKNVVRTTAEVGQDLPDWLRGARDRLVAKLAENDIPPARVEYNPNDPEAPWKHSLKFYFYTPFRAERAAELLPPWVKPSSDPPKMLKNVTHIRTLVISETQVGQVAGTEQSTPWTCGPAALRAVLAHHGDDVSEDRIAVLAGNVPILGVRPDGLVKAARELGYYVNATVLRGVDALAPFLAHDLPVLVVVDSWTHPGRAGHWVVVTALEGGNVRIMDPHTPGNWRVIPRAEFDVRWWHREQGRVVRRFAIIVAPEGRVAVGADEAKPTHGRTANLVYKGMPKWLDVLGKVQRGVTKALVTAFSGGLAAKATDAVQSQLMNAANKMNAKEFATWLNNATNEEVAALRLGQVRKLVKESKGDKSKLLGRLGLTSEVMDGPIEGALTALLREELFSSGTSPMLPPQQQLHFLQACAILLYGADTLPLLDERLKSKPKVKDWKKEPGLTTFLDWSNVTLAVLDKYAEDHAEPPKDFA